MLDQSQDTPSNLAAKLATFYDGLDEYERHSLHLLTSVALGNIAPQGDVPAEGLRQDVWKTGIKLLAHINPSGLSYVGEPQFMRDYLARLKEEANEQKAIAHRTGPQELSPGGGVATALAGDDRLKILVEKSVGFSVDSTLISSYLYYNREGDNLYPHVDTEAFAINCILLLEHIVPDYQTSKSALLVWDVDTEKRRIELDSGEMAILHASGTVHAREAVRSGELVTMLTIGFTKVI